MKKTTKAAIVVLAEIAIVGLVEIAIDELIRRSDKTEQKRH